jgi:hypothetical protein
MAINKSRLILLLPSLSLLNFAKLNTFVSALSKCTFLFPLVRTTQVGQSGGFSAEDL